MWREVKSVPRYALSALAVLLGGGPEVRAAVEVSSFIRNESHFRQAVPPREEVEVDGVTVSSVIVDGRVENVDGSTVPDNYLVRNQGVLNVTAGAEVKSVVVEKFSRANIFASMVSNGLNVYSADAAVVDSSVNNNVGTGLIASGTNTGGYHGGSEVDVLGSTISGAGTGALIGPGSVVTVSGSQVTASLRELHGGVKVGEGIRVAGGSLVISSGSYIEGALLGMKIIDADPAGEEFHNSVVVDNSVVRGQEAAAILIDTDERNTDLSIRNGSNLIAGNGVLLDVKGAGVSNFDVDNSTLNGNLVADDTSTLNVTLQRNAQLTGNIINSNTLAINSGGSWTMADDNQVKSLAMRGGRVSFGEGAFKTLTLNELSGRGTFDMRVNLDNAQGDLLRVAGQASGNHRINVKNTGVDVVDPDMSPLLIVDTDGGDARFSLSGGRVDLGVYSYELEQQGDDWFIVGSDKTISPSTQSVLALFNAAPNIWNSELTTLRSRMGEVRGQEQGGSWMRAYGSRFNASTGDGVDYRNNQSGVSLGADAPLPVSVGQLSLGLMAGYSKNDLTIGEGTSGKIDSYYVGGYGTWLLDDGYYLDAVLKLNRFRNESKVAMSDGAKAKGDYDSTGVGGSVEVGRHIKLADGYFLEPYAQFSSVWIDGDRYALDNGMQASNDRTQSVLGKVGTAAGRSINLKDGGVLKPYLRVAVAQEFSRSNEVKVNTTRFDNELFGSRAEVGAGVSVSLSERLQLHADLDYMKGKHVEQPWGANVGLKLAF
jgi:outer membrane autotransporter protein